ncbi:MAG TPA: hypothetical protein VGL81_07415 [Polyangiaceae bacterium]
MSVWRASFPAVAALGLLLACGKGSHATGGGSTPCGDYFAAMTLGPCPLGPTLPSDAWSRESARFQQVCQSWSTLPGSQITDAQLEACASAIQSAGCVPPGAIEPACLFVGALAPGAACNENLQCQSGLCFFSAAIGDAGPETTVTTCGQCVDLTPVGQPCSANTCVQGAACDLSASPPACVTPTSGPVGSPCNGVTTGCDATSYCDAAAAMCVPTLAQGQSCGADEQCTPPSTCRAQTCSPPGSTGDACLLDNDCAAGLGCSQSSTCGAVTWAASGDSCGDLVRCTVGFCPLLGPCPAVVADGQPCDATPASTCDELSTCVSGTCALADSNVCM